LVRVLYGRAPVRLLLQETEGRELGFVQDLLRAFADDLVVGRGDEAALMLLSSTYDVELVVVARDTWRPEDTELCGRIHALRLTAPVLAVSGSCDAGHRAAALRAGADDFMSVPFEIDEVVARAFALVRRASAGSRYARGGPFTVDLARRQIAVRERRISLTLREYDLLSTLIERAGEVLTRRDLETRATATAGGTESNAVDVHMSRIREKLGPDANYIETVRGLGYRLRRS
jgi:DNA-binding response OmpR family regulator